jgi:hypothetical protein
VESASVTLGCSQCQPRRLVHEPEGN